MMRYSNGIMRLVDTDVVFPIEIMLLLLLVVVVVVMMMMMMSILGNSGEIAATMTPLCI